MQGQSLISAGARIASRNKRYVIWFYLLNLVLAWFGAAAFTANAGAILDHSLYSDRLLHGFDLGALAEMLIRPDLGAVRSSTAPEMAGAIVFFLASLIFMPGVLLGYSSDHRISRQEFYRASGRNLWRFVRLFVICAIVLAIVGGILFGIQGALVKAVDRSVNDDRLPFAVQMVGMAVIFLVMTFIRTWFDLSEADVVLRDEGAVRKSLGWAFSAAWRNLRLCRSYVVSAIVGLIVLAAGIVLWNVVVPPSSVLGAFLVSQVILLILLAIRFWQRASAVAFYLQVGEEPATEVRSAAVSATAV